MANPVLFTGAVPAQGYATCDVCKSRFEYPLINHPLPSDLSIVLDANQKQTNLDLCPIIGCSGVLLKW